MVFSAHDALGKKHPACVPPCFETQASPAPQHEGLGVQPLKREKADRGLPLILRSACKARLEGWAKGRYSSFETRAARPLFSSPVETVLRIFAGQGLGCGQAFESDFWPVEIRAFAPVSSCKCMRLWVSSQNRTKLFDEAQC